MHSQRHPLHITLRAADGVPNLRGKQAFRALKRALQLANTQGKHREHFRVTHYSVQGNHIHLIAEASSGLRLSRGVQGLSIRMARRLNLSLERSGRVFSERYHARALRTPREVRHALAYVLLNERRHLAKERALSLPPWYFDPCSSACEFEGRRALRGLDPPPRSARNQNVPFATPLAPPRPHRTGRSPRLHGSAARSPVSRKPPDAARRRTLHVRCDG